MSGDGTADVFAAGALVWRIKKGELQVLAVHRPRYEDWSWPKGKVDPGESMPACAVREVAEETGKQIALGMPLPSLRYPISGGKLKHVRYWAARVLDDDHPAVRSRPQFKPASKHEIDERRWLTVDEARALITFRDDLRPLERLVEAHRSGRLDTRPTLIMRHARAKRRKAWKGEDLQRPLTKNGTQRAQALVTIVGAFGTAAVTSSPARRCLDTATPYAAAAGLPLGTVPALTEEHFRSDPADTDAAYTELLRAPGARVISVHRPTLGLVVAQLRGLSDAWTRGALPRSNPYLPAGGVLVAHLTDALDGDTPTLVAVESYLIKTAK